MAAGEAAADVFVFPPVAAPIPPPPIAPPPMGPVIGNTGVYDGNGGLTPFASLTLNLIEPNPPTPLTFMGPDPGDNLDSLDIDGAPSFPLYYSLVAAFADPLEVPPGAPAPPNTATAMANGFLGGDVLVSPVPGGPPVLYAAAPPLRLDLFGTGTDDLDALILNDMTDGAVGLYTPTAGPYRWLTGTDMLLYSVRRDSALVGMPDGLFGAPIEEGDILIPLGPGAVPGIWIAAEAMGLATVRSGTAFSYGVPNMQYAGLDLWADDLDALDESQQFVPEPVALLQLILGIVLLHCRKQGR